MSREPIVEIAPAHRADARPEGAPGARVESLLLTQSLAMLRYALASGLSVPAATVQAVAAAAERAGSAPRDPPRAAPDQDVRALAGVHAELAHLVAPATPHTLVLLGGDATPGAGWRRFVRIPVVAQMMTAAILAILAFVGLSLTGSVSELFFLSAAALGAAFSALFEIMRSLDRGELDPRQQYTYWIKFLLGLVAGLILATILHVNGAAAGAPPDGAASDRALHLSSAGLALVGGYSSSLLHRVLGRLTESLEALLTGGAAAAPAPARPARGAPPARTRERDSEPLPLNLEDAIHRADPPTSEAPGDEAKGAAAKPQAEGAGEGARGSAAVETGATSTAPSVPPS